MLHGWTRVEHDDIVVMKRDGVEVAMCAQSDKGFIEKDGMLFRNLDGTAELKPYEDWRLSAQDRACDLASRLSIRQIAGLMLYSSHQTVTRNSNKYAKLFGCNTYGGVPFDSNVHCIWQLTDQQKAFLERDGIRHILLSSVDSAEDGVRWTNEIQRQCEKLPFGIPANISSDPRHGISADAEYNLGSGSDISHWPEGIGMAATFDPQLVNQFGDVASREYRALGIATALSPQVDLATEPRWRRFGGTFGPHPDLSAEMARAYCDGMQTTCKSEDGWGFQSVNAMVKHWPGGGTGEGGRDAHYCYGKYAVYPGGAFEKHLKPFLDGAFALNGGTKCASAVMPYYTISHGVGGEDVGNGFSEYIINELLRKRYEYDGVVCTDWMITHDYGPNVETFAGKCWGVETLSEAERHYRALLAGVDQFGGNNDVIPLLEAYDMLVASIGQEEADERFRRSARRLLVNMFRVGLFDNPYGDVKQNSKIVGCPEFTKAGYEAQLKSVVMVKNEHSALPMPRGARVYIPRRVVKEKVDWFGNRIPGKTEAAMNEEVVGRYFDVVQQPEDADFAIVCITSPISDGYDPSDRARGGNGYIPISLQYRPYQAVSARARSVAAGDPMEEGTDRSYKNKWSIVENEADLDILLDTKKQMGNKPVVVCMFDKKPGIVREFEREVDSMLIHFGVSNQALLEIICGEFEPSGLLPFQVPASMEAVESHPEDLPGGLECYVDSAGHEYGFAYGLNWSGVISDERTRRYKAL